MSSEAAEAQGLDSIYSEGTLALADSLLDFLMSISSNDGSGYSETLAMRQFRQKVQQTTKMNDKELRSRRTLGKRRLTNRTGVPADDLHAHGGRQRGSVQEHQQLPVVLHGEQQRVPVASLEMRYA